MIKLPSCLAFCKGLGLEYFQQWSSLDIHQFETMKTLLLIAAVSLAVSAVNGLDNGLARTPPMGWNPWERFRCNVDCEHDPVNCISERLFREMADALSSGGYKDVGYEYINMDDCWMAPERDAQGRLQPDPLRFPNGIKNLSDYVHSKGLKFGLYEDMGTQTCGGYPGEAGHIETDAQTFAEWGVDYVKMDGCHNLGKELFAEGFINMSRALNQTNRPIIFSCEWGVPPYLPGVAPNYTRIGEYCNTMRDYLDEQDSWVEMLRILDWYTSRQDVLAASSGPGKFIDMDFLVVGDFSLSFEQSQAQMALWSIMSSQLIMSNDLRKMDPQMKAILLNTEVLAISQDKLGQMGKMIYSKSYFELRTKVLDQGCYAAVFFSRATDMPHNFTTTMKDMAFNGTSFSVRDLFKHQDLGVFGPTTKLTVTVNPSGVVMIKATPTKKHFKAKPAKKHFKVY